MVVLFGLLSLLLYTRFAAGLDDGINSSLKTRAADLSAVASESDSRLDASPAAARGIRWVRADRRPARAGARRHSGLSEPTRC